MLRLFWGEGCWCFSLFLIPPFFKGRLGGICDIGIFYHIWLIFLKNPPPCAIHGLIFLNPPPCAIHGSPFSKGEASTSIFGSLFQREAAVYALTHDPTHITF